MRVRIDDVFPFIQHYYSAESAENTDSVALDNAETREQPLELSK